MYGRNNYNTIIAIKLFERSSTKNNSKILEKTYNIWFKISLDNNIKIKNIKIEEPWKVLLLFMLKDYF